MKLLSIPGLLFRLIPICFAGTAVSQTIPLKGGSDGSDGPLVVSAKTVIDLPPDGVFNHTTIRITEDGELRFRRNALNTPVYLLATGDVLIEGTVYVNAGDPDNPFTSRRDFLGGPVGFDGGFAGVGSEVPPGPGFGPGGGRMEVTEGPHDQREGNAAYATVEKDERDDNAGAVYGNKILIPLVGGSGGAGDDGGRGGGGGGAILIGSSTRVTLSGNIRAWGKSSANGRGGVGSGGAVRLVAPVIDGDGWISTGGGSGGRGRVRIDAIDRRDMDLRYGWTVESFGSNLVVFPDVIPRLDIIEAAGHPIPEGTGGRVEVTLPSNASEDQVVRLQARDFDGLINVELVLTPNSGKRITYAVGWTRESGHPELKIS